MAVESLKKHGHEVIPIGIRKGEINGVEINNEFDHVEEVDTVTLYLGPKNQEQHYQYILDLKPKRVIFNPGTFNSELIELLNSNGISTEEACTLVLLSTDSY